MEQTKKWYEYYCPHCKSMLAVEGLYESGTTNWYARIYLDSDGYITQGDVDYGDFDTERYECGNCNKRVLLEEEDAKIILKWYKLLENVMQLKDLPTYLGRYNTEYEELPF